MHVFIFSFEKNPCPSTVQKPAFLRHAPACMTVASCDAWPAGASPSVAAPRRRTGAMKGMGCGPPPLQHGCITMAPSCFFRIPEAPTLPVLAAEGKRVCRHVPRVRCLKYNWFYPPPFGLALTTWWCTLLCARIYVFCGRDLVQIEACPVWLWDSLLAAGRPKREAEGVEPTLDRILVVCLFWIWFRCVHFCSEMNQNHWAKFFVSTGMQRGRKGMAEPAGKASGSGLKEDRKNPLKKALKDPYAWTFPILYRWHVTHT